MTETRTYVCDICHKEIVKLGKSLVDVKLRYGYKEVEYHAHLACLDKLGLFVLPKPDVFEIDQTWLTGEKGEQVPPIQIKSASNVEEPNLNATCPECNLGFSIPTGTDPSDAVCPGCGYKYEDNNDD